MRALNRFTHLLQTHKALDGTLKMVFRADSSHSSVPCCASPEPKGSVHPQLQQRVKSVGSGVGGFSSSAKERGGNKSPQDAIVVPALQPEPVVGRAAGMIEAVLIPMGPQGERLTLCVSSQTGCAMNCKASAQRGGGPWSFPCLLGAAPHCLFYWR